MNNLNDMLTKQISIIEFIKSYTNIDIMNLDKSNSNLINEMEFAIKKLTNRIFELEFDKTNIVNDLLTLSKELDLRETVIVENKALKKQLKKMNQIENK